MGTTTRFGLAYPELSSAPNGPAQMQTLAESVDTALGTAVDDVAGDLSGRTDLLANGCFGVNQRGAASYTCTGGQTKYTVDRWKLTSGTGATNIVTPTATTVGSFADAPATHIDWDLSVAGSTDSLFEQRIEDVRTCAGSTIVVYVDGVVAASTKRAKVQVVQHFGTGGSPSADVTTTDDTITFGTARDPQFVSVSVPSISGKTIGSGGGSYLAVRLVRESGWETGVITLHRVGVIRGAAIVAPDRLGPGDNLARCQRYYQQLGPYGNVRWVGSGFIFSTTNMAAIIQLPTIMRVAPTVTVSAGNDFTIHATGQANTTAVAVSFASPQQVGLDATSSGLGAGQGAGLSTSQDPTNAAIMMDAEL